MLRPQGKRTRLTSLLLAVFISCILYALFSDKGHRLQAARDRFRHAALAPQRTHMVSHEQNTDKDPSLAWLGLSETAVEEDTRKASFPTQAPLPETVIPEIVPANVDSTHAAPPAPDPTQADAPPVVSPTQSQQEQPVQQAGQKPEEEEPQQESQATSEQEAVPVTDVPTYVKAIMDIADYSLDRLPCNASVGARYNSLRVNAETNKDDKIRYFFALDLHEIIHLLPTLVGSIVHTMRFLGPSSCALSIVEGRSKDGTPDVLKALGEEIEALGATYYYSTSDVEPKNGVTDRMEALAVLRNEALAPLTKFDDTFSKNANIIFLNDVGICPHDILELLYQHSIQHAHMTCGMDWMGTGESFYDIYIARSLVGETFFQIAQDGLWKFAKNLFWADRTARRKFEGHHPFQVYACWNGGAIIDAAPVMQRKIAFRRNNETEGECYMGEPTLFCKDLWRLKLGRIQVVPTINVGYADSDAVNATQIIKDTHGWVEDHVDVEKEEPQVEMVQWQEDPPSLVKCMVSFHDPYWVPST